MGKVKNSSRRRYGLYIALGAVILFGLCRLTFNNLKIPSTYQCPEEIPNFATNESIDPDLIIEILGFKHRELLVDMRSSTYFGSRFRISCSVVNGQAYVALAYQSTEDEFITVLQIIYFEGVSPVLQSFYRRTLSVRTDTLADFRAEANSPIIQDRNQNGLPEAAIHFSWNGCMNCVYGEIWMLEILPDGRVIDISPMGGGYQGGSDINGDGILDLIAVDELSSITSFYDPIFAKSVFSWNGEAYELVYMDVEGLNSEFMLERYYFIHPFNSICVEIQNGVSRFDGSANALARKFFNALYYYENFLDERERAWNLINPMLYEVRDCASDAAIDSFWEDMAKIRAYFGD